MDEEKATGEQPGEVERLRDRLRELEARLPKHARVEQELRQTEATLRSIMESSEDHIMLVDREARIVFINHTVPDLTPEQVVGRPVFDFMPPSFHAPARACFDRVLSTAEPDWYDCDYRDAQGDTSYFTARVYPVLRDGNVSAMSVIATNVTERRRQEQESERFFRLSLDLLCVVGKDACLARANPAFVAVLGYELRELADRPFLDFVHAEDTSRTREFLLRLERGHDEPDFEHRFAHKDGSYRTISWRATFDPKGSLIYAVGRDVTERNQLEQQVRHSQKMDAVGQLAGGVAHDFNNLIQAVLANAAIALQDTAEDDPRYESLAEIARAGRRAAKVTQQLLALGHKQSWEPDTLDLNRLCEGLLALLRRLLPEHIELDFIPGHSLATVNGDYGQLEQVVVNLCVNARDAMAEGGRITIETENIRINGAYSKQHPWARPGRYVLMTVSDTGSGMQPEVRARAFEPFFTTKPKGQGSGSPDTLLRRVRDYLDE